MTTAEPTAPPPAAPWTWKGGLRPRPWSPAEFRRMLDLRIFAGVAVELVGGTVCYRDRKDGALHPFAFTRTEYYAIGDAGLFRDGRVQLIGGVILEETIPMNPPHAVTLRIATKVLERVFAAGYDVRPQLPLNLRPVSEPHPDLAVVVGATADFAKHHPTAAVLVVEVSDSTFDTDTHFKMSLYAAAGVADYWVIDLTGATGRVLVFRDPRPEAGQPFGHAYGRVSAHTRDDVLTPLAAPDARVPVADLLP